VIAGFEVGAVFRIVDEATAPLRKILATIREVTDAVKVARDEMAGFGAAVAPGISAAITETSGLAGAWTRAAESSVAAARVMNESAASAAAAARTAAAASGAATAATSGVAAAAGGGAAGHWPGRRSTGVNLSPVPLGGGAHLHGSNTTLGIAALAGLSLFEAANMETDVHWLNYHLGRADNTSNNNQSQKLIEDTMKSTGLGLPEVGKAVTDIARIMRDTPNFDVVKEAPRLLRAALTESLSKGTTLDESVKSILGMTHMLQTYDPAEMEKLYRVFAYLSTANPATLGSMEKTYSYAIPMLKAGGFSPQDIMLLSTVLSTSGVTQSKAGTWTRSLGERLMKGNKAHNAMLTGLGLLDENGKPTWFTDGKPDMAKALEIAGPIAAALPPERRLSYEKDLFGERGGGAFAVLGSPMAIERYHQLRTGMNDPGNINRYNTILDDTMGTSKMVARTTMQEFNVALIELGGRILPPAIAGVKALSAALGWFEGKHRTQEDKTFKPNWMEHLHDWMPWSGASALPKLQNQSFLSGPEKVIKPTPISLSLNVDGQTLAQTMSTLLQDMYTFANGAPAGDASQMYVEPHDNRVRT
jgi:TP901 family phage tail tape measure protein